MSEDQPPMTDAERAELTAELVDLVMQIDRMRRRMDDIASRISADNRVREATLHPFRPRPSGDGDE